MVQAVLYGEEIQKCPGFYRGTDQKDFAEKVQGLYNHSVIFLSADSYGRRGLFGE